jgi:hypothetical protein
MVVDLSLKLGSRRPGPDPMRPELAPIVPDFLGPETARTPGSLSHFQSPFTDRGPSAAMAGSNRSVLRIEIAVTYTKQSTGSHSIRNSARSPRASNHSNVLGDSETPLFEEGVDHPYLMLEVREIQNSLYGELSPSW